MNISSKNHTLTSSLQLLPASIALVRKYIVPLLYLYLIPSVIIMLGLILIGDDGFSSHPTSRESIGALLALAGVLIAGLTAPGFILMQVRAARGRTVGTLEVFRTALPRIWALIGYSLLLTSIGVVLIIIGMTALTIPAGALAVAASSNTFAAAITILIILVIILLARFFALAPYYIVANKMGPIESMRQSHKDSKPFSSYIWGTVGVYIALMIPGVAISSYLPGVGDILSTLILLTYVFAFAIRFVEITKQDKSKPPKK